MPEMIHVSENTFKNEVLDSSQPVLVDFSAVWCQPCKMLDPIVKQLAGEWEGKVKVVKIDADENPNLVMQFGVMGIPPAILQGRRDQGTHHRLYVQGKTGRQVQSPLQLIFVLTTKDTNGTKEKNFVYVAPFAFKSFYPKIISSNASNRGGTTSGFCISFVMMSGSFNP